MSSQKHKIAIVGVGSVGSTIAYTLMMSSAIKEIALIDSNKEKAEGEALDLLHCVPFTNEISIIGSDDIAHVKDASIVIITAGKAQLSGQTRSDLLSANIPIFKHIIPAIVKHNPQCILLIVTNPLDVLTYVAWKLSGFPSCRVIGSGTVLDSARLRYLMGSKLSISPKDITLHVLGEHGDSEFVWWSQASIAGIPLHNHPAYNQALINQCYADTKNAAYQIINKKGATFYAISMIVAKIVRSILLDQSRVFTLSTWIEHIHGIQDVYLSVPTIVRGNGICEHLPLLLNQEELKHLHASASKIKKELTIALSML